MNIERMVEMKNVLNPTEVQEMHCKVVTNPVPLSRVPLSRPPVRTCHSEQSEESQSESRKDKWYFGAGINAQ